MRSLEKPGVVFDLDGLMLRTAEAYASAHQSMATALGRDYDVATHVGLLMQPRKPRQRSIDIFFSHFGIELCEEQRRYWEARRNALIAERRVEMGNKILKPGILGLVTYLDNRNVPMAISTASEREHALANLGVQDQIPAGIFVDILTRDEDRESRSKVHNNGLAAQRLIQHGADPDSIWMLEDSPSGIAHAALTPEIRYVIGIPDPYTSDGSDGRFLMADAVLENLATFTFMLRSHR